MSHVWPIWLPLRAGIQYWHSSPGTNRGPEERRNSKKHLKLHPNNDTCGTKEEDTGGTQQSSGWRTSLWYYKGKVSPPKCFLEESHHTCPGINSCLITLTSMELSWLAPMGDWNTTLQSKFYDFLSCFNANKQEILFSQTLLGHVTLLTPDQLLRGCDCSAWEGTSRYPHQLLGYQERGIKI